jgi:HPt (histidine-containing phosphotransfer) domain-containing protein
MNAQHLPALDMDSITEAVDILGDRFGVLVEGYINDTQSIFASINVDRAAGSYDSISNNVHSLKSSSHQVGAHLLSGHCVTIEHFMHNNQNDIASLYFQTKFDGLIDELRTHFADYQTQIKIYLGNHDK